MGGGWLPLGVRTDEPVARPCRLVVRSCARGRSHDDDLATARLALPGHLRLLGLYDLADADTHLVDVRRLHAQPRGAFRAPQPGHQPHLPRELQQCAGRQQLPALYEQFTADLFRERRAGHGPGAAGDLCAVPLQTGGQGQYLLLADYQPYGAAGRVSCCRYSSCSRAASASATGPCSTRRSA